ncbi:hypothetical protein BHE74_00020215 [Ensete ventricosum]|nr:hypothetical protein BHE74_00020215 [Ensete ventricosum]RZR93034.1 hypothetical protein BHM03_00021428 [Ensete ventricosum]
MQNRIADAEEHLGESEVREAHLAKSLFFIQIGDKNKYCLNYLHIFRELSRFIATGKLHCKIDKVAGILETNRPGAKNALYQATIKQGDFLLNRIQKLSRVIDL